MKLEIQEKIQNINKDDLMKIIILSEFLIFFAKLIVTGQIYNYVHPRIIIFVYFAIVGFILMIIGVFRKMKLVDKNKIRVKKYIVLILALSFIVYMESSGLVSSMSSENYVNSDKSIDSVNSDYNFNSNNKTLQDSNGASAEDIELNEVDGVITIGRDNYVFSLDAIMNNSGKYNGRKIDITGFVYRDSSEGRNEFILARYMMVCCAADLQIAGIKCSENFENNIAADTWVKVKGTITNVNDEAVIDADSVDIDENPDKMYVYPY